MDNSEKLILMITVFWWAMLLISFISDRSRYRNCYFLFFALGSTVASTVALSYDRVAALSGLALTITAALLIVPVFLIHNGIVMYRREGHSLANLLSLFLGIIVAVGEIATIYLLLTGVRTDFALQHAVLTKVVVFISISVIYGSVSFLVFMIYSVFLMIIPRKKDFDYVIIHGAGLLDGSRVSKLLADRIDKAILVYKKDPSPPILIPSGGKGGDETVSEAEAMAEYMRAKGIPDEHILPEDESKTTLENLKNSKALIDAREGRKYTALVTSNYHVYRALRYCRKIGLKCTGIGSHVALYYWPSALIREFVAIHREPKHLLYFIGGWIIFAAVLIVL